MLTIKEYILDPLASWQLRAIHDGWSPLCLRVLDLTIPFTLVVLVDDEREEKPEVFRLLTPGMSLKDNVTNEATELAFLGHAYGSKYLFVEVAPEGESQQGRRLGRLDLAKPESTGLGAE